MKIVLAVDLHEAQKDSSIYDELKFWCQDVKTDVKPVFIESWSGTGEVLCNYIDGFADIKVIHSSQTGRKKEIEALLSYANTEKADLIALVSQGKAGLEKKLLGSFAETLLLKSEIPILFLEDEANSKIKSNKVLFATDFSDSSIEGFDIFLKHMKSQNSEIIVFNAIPLPQFTASSHIYSQALNVLPQHYWDEQRQWAENKGNELIKKAQRYGVTIRLEIANQVYSIENAIHEVVRREQVKLVAMVSVSSPLQRLLIGSVSRAILRTRIKPIWICGPQCIGVQNVKEE